MNYFFLVQERAEPWYINARLALHRLYNMQDDSKLTKLVHYQFLARPYFRAC